MGLLKISRKFHKWLMLFAGVQFVIWLITGVYMILYGLTWSYMVLFDINYIHGDSLVINHQTKIDPNSIHYSLKSLLNDYPQVKQISVGTFINQNVYRFFVVEKKRLIHATSGQLPSPIDKQAGQAAARYY
jgi:Cu(I)/Ag(I) efflux system membrane protein CusA/SilA